MSAKQSFEIHCPNCGVLIRVMIHRKQLKCPDCMNTQAIFLPFMEGSTNELLFKHNKDIQETY